MRNKKRIAVIDGDLVAYRCAAAAEERYIEVIHKSSGRQAVFKNRTEFKSQVDPDKFPLDDFQIEDKQDPQPLEYCLHSVKVFLEGIKEAVGCSDMIVSVSGPWNFRDELPLPEKYKGNRSNMVRPVHLTEAKSYLKHKFDALETVGFESDDYLTMKQYESIVDPRSPTYIACSIDKDQMQCDPGTWIYDWDKMQQPYQIPDLGKLWIRNGKVRGYGLHWLALQTLCGDTTDNLRPRYLCKVKYGEKSAYKDLKDLDNEEDIWHKVLEKYQEWYPEPVTYTDQTGKEVTMDFVDMAETYGRGVYMLRYEDDDFRIRDFV